MACVRNSGCWNSYRLNSNRKAWLLSGFRKRYDGTFLLVSEKYATSSICCFEDLPDCDVICELEAPSWVGLSNSSMGQLLASSLERWTHESGGFPTLMRGNGLAALVLLGSSQCHAQDLSSSSNLCTFQVYCAKYARYPYLLCEGGFSARDQNSGPVIGACAAD